MDDFVAKPVDRRQLFDALARHLPAAAGAPRSEASSPADAAGDPAPPLIDDEVIRQLAEDVTEAAVPGMMGMFIGEAASRADNLLNAVQGFALAAIEDEAHTLKSCAGTFGAGRLQALARDLEAACREGDRAAVEELGERIGPLLEETLALYRARFDLPLAGQSEN